MLWSRTMIDHLYTYWPLYAGTFVYFSQMLIFILKENAVAHPFWAAGMFLGYAFSNICIIGTTGGFSK